MLCRRNGAFRSRRLLIASGGPQTWIETEYNRANVAWWGQTATAPLPDGVTERINDFLSQFIS